MSQNKSNSARIDKWLWCVRLFKTRSLATRACRSGKIKIDNEDVKPSREISEGTIITIKSGAIEKTVKVKELLNKRVGAKLVDKFMEDLTPEEEYKKIELIKSQSVLKRPKGLGRPTKKERREIDDWLNK